MRAIEPWVEPPLAEFLKESSARLVLLMTSSGQVVAQHGRMHRAAVEVNFQPRRGGGTIIRHRDVHPFPTGNSSCISTDAAQPGHR